MKTHPTLPALEWIPTTAFSSRHGVAPELVTLHRWAGGTFGSVTQMFVHSPHDERGKSAHFVYAGELGRDAGKCAQQVHVRDKAWTQAGWNPHCISIECADAIWVPDTHGRYDDEGFARLSRIVAFLVHYHGLPARWKHGAELVQHPAGVTRHADLGALGGGHTLCPTTDVHRWLEFMARVQHEVARGHFRPTWHR